MPEGYRDRHEYSLDSRQLGIVLLAVTVLAALVFVLGVSVGIQWEKRTATSDEPVAVETSGVPAAETEPGKPSAPAVAPGFKPDNDNNNGNDISPTGENKEVAEKAGVKEPAINAEKLTFPKTLTSKEPAAPKPKTPSAKAPQKSGAGVYTVQVGAFKEKGSAGKLVDRLKKAGYKAGYVRAEGPNGLYKVRVGSFASLADARDMAAKLESKEGLKPYVTSY